VGAELLAGTWRRSEDRSHLTVTISIFLGEILDSKPYLSVIDASFSLGELFNEQAAGRVVCGVKDLLYQTVLNATLESNG